MSDEAEPPKARFVLRPKTIERLNRQPGSGPDDAPIDVHAILRSNLQADSGSAKPVDLTRRPSRRRRDYWLLLVAGNAFVGLLLAVLPRNPVVLVFGLSGAVLFSVGITWIMWGVMSDD